MRPGTRFPEHDPQNRNFVAAKEKGPKAYPEPKNSAADAEKREDTENRFRKFGKMKNRNFKILKILLCSRKLCLRPGLAQQSSSKVNVLIELSFKFS